MPNQPRTPHRTIRCDPDLWEAAKVKAGGEGRTITDVIVAALRDYTGLQADIQQGSAENSDDTAPEGPSQ